MAERVKEQYETPAVETIDVVAESVICGSESPSGFGIPGYGDMNPI